MYQQSETFDPVFHFHQRLFSYRVKYVMKNQLQGTTCLLSCQCGTLVLCLLALLPLKLWHECPGVEVQEFKAATATCHLLILQSNCFTDQHVDIRV